MRCFKVSINYLHWKPTLVLVYNVCDLDGFLLRRVGFFTPLKNKG